MITKGAPLGPRSLVQLSNRSLNSRGVEGGTGAVKTGSFCTLNIGAVSLMEGRYALI